MRVGSNPQKKERKITLSTHHRVIVVVYIPNEEGFYKESFKVFKLCLDSLLTSINSKAAITVVNNGSYSKVVDLLNQYLNEKKIDTLISHNLNIGKIDALIGAARGVREKLITYTDSDIFFKKGWQENVERIFMSLPNVGSVSPIPVRKGLFYATSSVLMNVLLKKVKFKLEKIPENFQSYNKYLESINWEIEYNENELWPVIEKKSVKAIIGSGHQVLTIDKEVLDNFTPKKASLILVGGDSEYKYVDEPIDFSTKMRLSTYHNFAFHMGNTTESWMYELLDKNHVNININDNLEESFINKKTSNYSLKLKLYRLKKNVIKKLFKLFYYKANKY